MNCQSNYELLPWLLNESLDQDSRERLLSHLSACSKCRSELEETAALAGLLSVHVPSWDLAAHSQGLAPSEWTVEEIERHLAHCSGCSQEFELARIEDETSTPDVVGGAKIVSIASRRRQPTSPPSRIWSSVRSLAMAAGLAGTLVLGSWYARVSSDTVPKQHSTTGASQAITTATVSPSDGLTQPRQSSSGVLHSDDYESGVLDHWSGYVNAIHPSKGSRNHE